MNTRTAQNLLRQKAVYWANPVNDGQGGYTYDTPIEIDCRWLWKQEKFINDKAEEIVSKAIVLVDQDVAIKGMLALTTLDDLNSSELPEDEDAFEIKAFFKSSDYKVKSYTRKAWL